MRIVCCLECALVIKAVEDSGGEGGVPGDLKVQDQVRVIEMEESGVQWEQQR